MQGDAPWPALRLSNGAQVAQDVHGCKRLSACTLSVPISRDTISVWTIVLEEIMSKLHHSLQCSGTCHTLAFASCRQ